jgi:prepilin peptidase CpaA
MPLPAILKSALALLVVSAAITDLRARLIPNGLVVAGLICGFALNMWWFGWSGLRSAGLGMGAALLVYLPLFLIRAMAGGDVKLMAAVGSLAGPHNWFVIFILTALFGGLIAFTALLARGALGRALRNVLHIFKSFLRLRTPYAGHEALDVSSASAMTLPHGVAIALGTLTFVLFS